MTYVNNLPYGLSLRDVSELKAKGKKLKFYNEKELIFEK